jgi:hypothetical protein
VDPFFVDLEPPNKSKHIPLKNVVSVEELIPQITRAATITIT